MLRARPLSQQLDHLYSFLILAASYFPSVYKPLPLFPPQLLRLFHHSTYLLDSSINFNKRAHIFRHHRPLLCANRQPCRPRPTTLPSSIESRDMTTFAPVSHDADRHDLASHTLPPSNGDVPTDARIAE